MLPQVYHKGMRLLLTSIAIASLFSCQSRTENDPGPAPDEIRFATFNIAMGREHAGQLGEALSSGSDTRLKQVAEILQRVRPDVLLLNEFDYDPAVDAAALFNSNYLAHSQNGQAPIQYRYHFQAEVNTGADSGLDLDSDGKTGGPGDAWGYGAFPGQYGMMVLSRLPIGVEKSKTFLRFPWSLLPGARRPVNPDGSAFYPDEIWQALRLSSKSHWDLVIETDAGEIHLLAHHPTPPVFDGPEDRNGMRNFDENRFWLNYTRPSAAPYFQDDEGRKGGIEAGAKFVIAGDFNADPKDSDSVAGAVTQLLEAPWINAGCVPLSRGAAEATQFQGMVNLKQKGDPAADTADFDDRFTGNLRLDYLLPSTGLKVKDCGVFWPAPGDPEHALSGVSDHHLVWLDIEP